MDVALATCRALPEHDRDEALLLKALHRADIDARMLAWDDTSARFEDATLTVLRSTWNYAWHADAFRAWLRRTADVSVLLNPLPILEWNLHKRYLLDLAARGIPTVPTELVARGSRQALADVLSAHGWKRAIVKPAISAGSRLTLAVGDSNAIPAEDHFRDVSTREDVLVQPYQEAVDGYGERAIVWIDGDVTHGIRKSRRLLGDHESVAHADVSASERDLATRAIAAAGSDLLYARVDMIPGPDGQPRIMELELLEPSLFLDHSPSALERFVAAIARRLAVTK